MTPKVQGKKIKVEQYQHARDNAIASIGKIIKYQTAYVQSNPTVSQQLINYWLELLPITHDVEEAQLQFEFLSDFLIEQPQFIFQGDVAAVSLRLAHTYSEAFQDKYTKEHATLKAKLAQSVKFLMDAAPAPVIEAFKNACQNVLAEDARSRVEAAYNFTA